MRVNTFGVGWILKFAFVTNSIPKYVNNITEVLNNLDIATAKIFDKCTMMEVPYIMLQARVINTLEYKVVYTA